jgi:predicted transcriptional regulator of viral defense system
MTKPSTVSAARFVEDLLAHGRYSFIRREAERRLGGSPSAVYMALRRLVKGGRLAMPRSGFYVIVDPQHRASGTLPPEWFIQDLMALIGKPYYVGLLSAAQIHGAAHHRPQSFQVVIPDRSIRPIRAGNARIRFFGKGPFEQSVIREAKSPAGLFRVSSPETTAWDLVRYPGAGGGLENVATVLSELSESLDAASLKKCVKGHGDLLVAQRLGFLLDLVDGKDLTAGLAQWVEKARAPFRPLAPSAASAGARESAKWRLRVNVRLEPET